MINKRSLAYTNIRDATVSAAKIYSSSNSTSMLRGRKKQTSLTKRQISSDREEKDSIHAHSQSLKYALSRKFDSKINNKISILNNHSSQPLTTADAMATSQNDTGSL